MTPRTSAIVCFAAAAIGGYAAHRLYFSIGEPDPRSVGPSVHVGYFWRLSTALWWGVLAGVGGWRLPRAGLLVSRLLPLLVLAAVIAAFVVP